MITQAPGYIGVIVFLWHVFVRWLKKKHTRLIVIKDICYSKNQELTGNVFLVNPASF